LAVQLISSRDGLLIRSTLYLRECMTTFSDVMNRLWRAVPSLLGLFLFGFSLATIQHQLKETPLSEIVASLKQTPAPYVLLAAVLVLLNYVMLTGYDSLATRYIGHPLPYRRSALVASLSYAISNGVGFSLLSSSAIRYRLYKTWGYSSIEVAKIIAFCNLSFSLGLLAAGGILFTIQPVAIPTLNGSLTLEELPFTSMRPIGVILLGLVAVYLTWNAKSRDEIKIGKWSIPHLPVWMSIALMLVTIFDWALSAGVLYAFLLPNLDSLGFVAFFSIYLLAQIAAILSNVPGGFGVFDGIIVVLLAPSVPSPIVVGALLGYRSFYHVIPFMVAVTGLGAYELKLRLKAS
jgi:uncharacterized membrane protein YbhN (UPF0104 family)